MDSENVPQNPERRKFIKQVAAGAATIFFAQDFIRGLGEYLSQYGEPKETLKAIDFLEKTDIIIPQDKLYGITFPSTKEIARKYKEMLSQTIGDPPISKLIVTEEKESTTVTLLLLKLLGKSPRDESPYVIKPRPGHDDPTFLYFPAEVISLSQRAIFLYHEGLHIFNQPPRILKTDTDVFETENMPTIGEILLEDALEKKGLFNRGFKSYYNPFYYQAAAENNPEVWERALKEIYQLPQDCCVKTQK